MRGMPGVSGPLVDDEGFPRGDIDLYAVRQARNKSPARFIRRGCSMPAEGVGHLWAQVIRVLPRRYELHDTRLRIVLEGRSGLGCS